MLCLQTTLEKQAAAAYCTTVRFSSSSAGFQSIVPQSIASNGNKKKDQPESLLTCIIIVWLRPFATFGGAGAKGKQGSFDTFSLMASSLGFFFFFFAVIAVLVSNRLGYVKGLASVGVLPLPYLKFKFVLMLVAKFSFRAVLFSPVP